MQLQLLKILSPIIMASYLVRETDFQLIVIVHGNMGEAGGTTTLMKFVLLIEILTASVLILEALKLYILWWSAVVDCINFNCVTFYSF